MRDEATERLDVVINLSVIHTIIATFLAVVGTLLASLVPLVDAATYKAPYAGHINHANAVRTRDSDRYDTTAATGSPKSLS